MVEVSGACGDGGDSGGPWTDQYAELALGIHSGGYRGCNVPQIYDPLSRVLPTLNVWLVTG